MTNGFIIGSAAFVFVGAYLDYFKGYEVREALEISGCIGISMLIAMTISAMVGTLIPMFFDKIKVDPAVASGPLISTLNDLVAVVFTNQASFYFSVHFCGGHVGRFGRGGLFGSGGGCAHYRRCGGE